MVAAILASNLPDLGTVQLTAHDTQAGGNITGYPFTVDFGGVKMTAKGMSMVRPILGQ
ncbi:hypothetical protein O9992_12975 [Vibrio lentus]|nr:hypothetical protein [Vibrio lentus]